MALRRLVFLAGWEVSPEGVGATGRVEEIRGDIVPDGVSTGVMRDCLCSGSVLEEPPETLPAVLVEELCQSFEVTGDGKSGGATRSREGVEP